MRSLMKFSALLRRFLRFWVASFGQVPALSHDLGLPATPERLPESQAQPAPRSAAVRELADEMAWGAHLKLDGGRSVRQLRM